MFMPELPKGMGLLESLNSGGQGYDNQAKQLANQTAQVNLRTLDGLNRARLSQLNALTANQKAQTDVLNQKMPYIGSQASADVGLTKAQTGLAGAQAGLTNQQSQYFPYTAYNSRLMALGKLAPNLGLLSGFRYAPDVVKDAAAAAAARGDASYLNTPTHGLLPQGALDNAFAPPGLNLPLSQGQVNTLQNRTGASTPNQLALPGTANDQASPNVNPQTGYATDPDLEQQAQTQGANKVASPALIQKSNFANNLLTTLDRVNLVDSLGPYTGLKGQAQLRSDQLAASLGNASPQYQKYTQALKQLPVLGEQQGQFFQGSRSQDAAEERTNNLIAPVTTQTPANLTANMAGLADIITSEATTAAKSAGTLKQIQPLIDRVRDKYVNAYNYPIPKFNNYKELQSWLTHKVPKQYLPVIRARIAAEEK